jgi:hypothetical protein
MNADSTPPVETDASERAFRTLIQGLAFDVAAAIVVALSAAIAPGIEWTRAYWVALALAIGKSAVVSMVSYFARKLVPPAGGGAS